MARPGAFYLIFAAALLASAPAGASVLHQLNAGDSIEVRDANNRVVSVSALRREIGSGTREVEARGAELSQVGGMRAFVAYLERLEYSAPVFRTETPGADYPAAVVPAAPLKSPKARVPAVTARAPESDSTRSMSYSPLQLTTTPGRVRVLPLLL